MATAPALRAWRHRRWPPASPRSVSSPARDAPNRWPPRRPPRTPVSCASVVDGRSHLPIGEPGLRASSNPLLEVAQAFYAATDLVQALCPLGDQACDRL